MTQKIRIAVMGCAKIAQRSTIPAILELSDKFQLVAIASRTQEKADVFAEQFNCLGVVGYESIINMPDVDAIYMPLPTGLHYEWVLKALNSGKHVYVEKSIAFSYEEANEMVELAKNENLALMEGYMFLSHQQTKYAKEIINSGRLGEVRFYYGSFGFPPLDRDNFRYDNKIGGGALYDAAGYPLKALHYLLGNDFKVSAAAISLDVQGTSSIHGSAFFKNSQGTGASISFGFDNFYQCRYEVWGEKGKLIVDRAYTAGPTFTPIIYIEDINGIEKPQLHACNHFVGAFEKFYSLIMSDDEKVLEYGGILLQSHSLDQIKRYASA